MKTFKHHSGLVADNKVSPFMIIESDKIVTLAYTLRENNAQGPILETMDQHYPFRFYFGGQRLLPAFEAQVQGLQEGATFAFTLPPEAAYGPVEPANILAIPRRVFDESRDLSLEQLAPGDYVQLTDEQGTPHQGKLVDWDETRVNVDFNHHLAGKTLYFKGVVLHIRAATQQEKLRRAYIETGGVHQQ